MAGLALFAGLAIVTSLLTGCGVVARPGGAIQIQSLAGEGLDPAGEEMPAVRVNPNLRTALYRTDNNNQISVLLSDLDAEELAEGRFPASGFQVILLEMLWLPRAGATPLDPTSTNATVRHLIFGPTTAVGVYGGGGFIYPRNDLGDPTLRGSVYDATLRLTDASDDFINRLGVTTLTGTFTARRDRDPNRDDALLDDIAITLNTELSRRLGRVMFVMGD